MTQSWPVTQVNSNTLAADVTVTSAERNPRGKKEDKSTWDMLRIVLTVSHSKSLGSREELAVLDDFNKCSRNRFLTSTNKESIYHYTSVNICLLGLQLLSVVRVRRIMEQCSQSLWEASRWWLSLSGHWAVCWYQLSLMIQVFTLTKEQRPAWQTVLLAGCTLIPLVQPEH